MSLIKITAGYMPLVDAAPLIVAKEMGFAEEEGLALNLMPSPSWSTLRDMLAFGQIQAAHMLSPVPVASWLGLMNGLPKLQTLSVMSMNGNVIGVSPAIAEALEALGLASGNNASTSSGTACRNGEGIWLIGLPLGSSAYLYRKSLTDTPKKAAFLTAD